MKDENCKKLLELIEDRKVNLKKYQEAKKKWEKSEQDYIESLEQHKYLYKLLEELEEKMMIGYYCITCKKVTIKRPIKENELIMSGKTRCPKCGEWIIYFKVIINE